MCTASYFLNVPSNTVDVSLRFRDVLKVWWAYALTDFVRSVIGLIAVNINSKGLARVYQILVINDFFGIIAVLMVHTYRFQYSGQYCSGDFLANDS